MARLLGVEIPNDKRIEIALTYVYGIGLNTSQKVLDAANVDPNIRAGKLSDEQLAAITHTVQDLLLLVEGDLRRENSIHLKRLTSIGCYRGIRHKRGLPVRGQRTSTNARTRKGKKKTVGVQRNKNTKKGKV